MSMDDYDKISRRRFLHLGSMGMGALSAGMWLPMKSIKAAGPVMQQSGQKKKVLVLGAGLAGLAAAWELNAAGDEVTVLEARNRAGGRVHTLRAPFAEDLYAEAGAVAFSAGYAEANRYISALGLEKVDWPVPDLRALYYLKGHRLTEGPNEEPDWPYKMTPEEKKMGPWGILKKCIFATLPEEAADVSSWNKVPLSDLDKMSLGEYMREKGASQGAVNLIRDTQWFGMAVDNGSALSSIVADFAVFMGGAPFLLVGGNDRLPTEMARRLSRNIRYGSRVVAVRDTGDRVEVDAQCGGQRETFKADRVVCTLPVPVMQEVEFSPALPPGKQTALEKMPYLAATRTYLQVRQSFWIKEGVAGSAATDLPVQNITKYPVPWKSELNRRVVLESMVQGPEARRLAQLPENKIVEQTVQGMEKVHPDIRKYLEVGEVKAWSNDPYAKAAYSWPAPGDVTRYLPALQKPHGCIHFAGEHTSVLRGLMEGALRSGIRAAKEIRSKT